MACCYSDILLVYVFFLFTIISFLSNYIRKENKKEEENEIVFLFIRKKDYYIEKQNIKRINVK